MNVSVFGLGYVGSVSAASFAGDGHTVTGVDVNAEKVASLNEGRSPIVEKGLEELIRDHMEPFGFSAEDVHAALRETPETTRRLTELGWYLLAVEHVMNKAKVTFEGAEQG